MCPDLEGADRGVPKGGCPCGAHRLSERHQYARIWKGRIGGPRGGVAPVGHIGCLRGTNVPGFGRGGSGVPERGCPCGAPCGAHRLSERHLISISMFLPEAPKFLDRNIYCYCEYMVGVQVPAQLSGVCTFPKSAHLAIAQVPAPTILFSTHSNKYCDPKTWAPQSETLKLK